MAGPAGAFRGDQERFPDRGEHRGRGRPAARRAEQPALDPAAVGAGDADPVLRRDGVRVRRAGAGLLQAVRQQGRQPGFPRPPDGARSGRHGGHGQQPVRLRPGSATGSASRCPSIATWSTIPTTPTCARNSTLSSRQRRPARCRRRPAPSRVRRADLLPERHHSAGRPGGGQGQARRAAARGEEDQDPVQRERRGRAELRRRGPARQFRRNGQQAGQPGRLLLLRHRGRAGR